LTRAILDLTEIFANLKCPKCFSRQVTLCQEETEENAAFEMCGCEFKFNPEIPQGGMD
jgi:transcription elongation factor Elf1